MAAAGALRQIIAQVDILADGAVHAADVADQPTVQKYPQIVVAEEGVFQRADVILRQLEIDREVHAEEPVVRPAVISGRERAAAGAPAGGGAAAVGIALIIALAAVCAPQAVRPAGGRIQRPEVVGKNAALPALPAVCTIPDAAAVRRRMEEVLQAVDGMAAAVGVFQRGRPKSIGVTHPVKAQRAARKGTFALCFALVEQVRGDDPVVIAQGAVGVQPLHQPEGSLLITEVGAVGRVEIAAVEHIPAHAGTAVLVAERQHIRTGGPGALSVAAGGVVLAAVDTGRAGTPAAAAFAAGNIVIVKGGVVVIVAVRGAVAQPQHRALLNEDGGGVCLRGQIGKGRGILLRRVPLPVGLGRAGRVAAGLQHADRLQPVAFVFLQLVDIAQPRRAFKPVALLAVHPRQLFHGFHPVQLGGHTGVLRRFLAGALQIQPTGRHAAAVGRQNAAGGINDGQGITAALRIARNDRVILHRKGRICLGGRHLHRLGDVGKRKGGIAVLLRLLHREGHALRAAAHTRPKHTVAVAHRDRHAAAVRSILRHGLLLGRGVNAVRVIHHAHRPIAVGLGGQRLL